MKNLFDFLRKSGVSPSKIVDTYESIRALEHAYEITFNAEEIKLIISAFERCQGSSPNSLHLFSKV